MINCRYLELTLMVLMTGNEFCMTLINVCVLIIIPFVLIA
jgi:hypothetical protein